LREIHFSLYKRHIAGNILVQKFNYNFAHVKSYFSIQRFNMQFSDIFDYHYRIQFFYDQQASCTIILFYYFIMKS